MLQAPNKVEFVIACKEYGVFLGQLLGLAFWSHLSCEGIDSACTFQSEEQAKQFIASWVDAHPEPRVVPVLVSKSGKATIEECVAAGLPSWRELLHVKK